MRIPHICEIQFQLASFAAARKQAHKYYRILRESIPKVCGSAHLEALQTFILSSLETVQRQDFKSKINTCVDMDRSKGIFQSFAGVSKIISVSSTFFICAAVV